LDFLPVFLTFYLPEKKFPNFYRLPHAVLMDHEDWMRQALRLARKGLGQTNPNPCVGCVIVRNKKMLGKGWHKKAGRPHAEVEAIHDAQRQGHSLRGATAYITLEPCCTTGRTPPCTEALIREKVACVVVAATDPNPAHAGRAYPLLRQAGIKVITGVLVEEADALNRPFKHWIVTGKPWVIAKAALSVDGKLSRPRGEGPWLTGAKALRDVHKLRSQCDAILIGAETARQDNPHLTVRLGKAAQKQPWRVVVTKSGKLPQKLCLLSDEYASRTLIYQNKTWNQVLRDLGKKGVTRLLVEGGACIFRDLITKKLVNEAVLYFAPLNYSAHPQQSKLVDASFLLQLTLQETQITQLGPDLKVQGIFPLT
jgi:diaminohydroxyphosphoribosylaminopyrimidine deaminase / 5-amino-6-(5-phosphoribosylamino)uracil reductase